MRPRNIVGLIARHEAFLQCAPADRPLMGLWLGGYFPAEQYPEGTRDWREGQALGPEDVRFERFRQDYERLFRLHEAVEDDFFFVASAYWGIPWMEAIAGCPVFAGKASSRAEPRLVALDDADGLSFDLDRDPWFRCLVEFTDELIAFADGRFPVCAPLFRGPGDIACAMRGGMDFVTDFVDAPDRMAALLSRCAELRLETFARLQSHIPAWHGAYAGGGYPSRLCSRHPVAYNQEDSAALLSPALFSRFLMPLERKMAEAAPVSFIHLHSACLYPIEPLLSDGAYTAIEINIDHEGAGPPLHKLLPVFRRIQAAKRPLVLWGHMSREDLAAMRAELDPAGLSLQPIVEPGRDAREFETGAWRR